jgi:hypothetical protein
MVVSLTQWPPLPPRRNARYSFLLRVRVDPRNTVRPEELSQLKMSATSAGIKPATFSLLAQCVNQVSVTHSLTLIGYSKSTINLNIRKSIQFSQALSFCVPDVCRS